jgi:hypothetical protein
MVVMDASSVHVASFLLSAYEWYTILSLRHVTIRPVKLELEH